MAVKTLDEAMQEAAERTRLVYIDVDKIEQHPDNPRKDLGDLTELADSIKAKGIMQNLTVVPFKSRTNPKFNGAGRYTVVIGHRRLAAAKMAGLTEVPCVIVDMTEQEQVATMLLENVQRVDLTVYEQAQCFKQLSIDFGMSVDTISEQTGFSGSTVRRRLKLCELDQGTLKKVSGRQISLGDLEKLSEIEDPKEKNKVLAEIGTRNFDQALLSAKNEQARRKKEDGWRRLMEARGAIEIPRADRYSNKFNGAYDWISGEPDDSVLAEKMKPGVQYYWYYDWGNLYIKTLRPGDELAKKDAEKAEQSRREERQNACKEALEEAFIRAYTLRRSFIEGISEREAKAMFPQVARFLANGVVEYGADFDHETFCRLMGVTDQRWEEIESTNEDIYPVVRDEVEANPYWSILAMAYAAYEDRPGANCYNWRGEFVGSGWLKSLYDRLTELGYEMSDEERELLDGSSSMYYREVTS